MWPLACNSGASVRAGNRWVNACAHHYTAPVPEPQIRYCTTTDGVSIAYYAMGEGETLLIASNILWSNLRYSPLHTPEYQREGEGVGRDMRVVRYDARGSGMSDRSALDFSLDARMRDLEAVVGKAAPRTFVLFGMYHGAAAAVEYAARNPDRVTRLVLAHPIVDGAAMQEQTRRWDSLRAMAAEEWEEYTITMAATAVGYERPDRLQLLAHRFREAMSPPAVQRMYEDMGMVDVRESLSGLTMPVLLVYREHAIKFPSLPQVEETATAIPNCEFVHTQGTLGEFWTQEETEAVERFVGVTPEPPIEPRPARTTPRSSGGLQTIVFTDIEANTELLQRVGDAAWRDILREHERTTRVLLAEHGGTEIKTIGDAFMTSFNSASAAIDCAIALQQAFRHEEAHPHGPLRIRIGINAGEPIAEHDPAGRGDLFGTAVTTASRVQSMAKGGEILVTDVVRQLVAGKGFLFDDRGEHTLRGFEDPVRIFAVRTGD